MNQDSPQTLTRVTPVDADCHPITTVLALIKDPDGNLTFVVFTGRQHRNQRLTKLAVIYSGKMLLVAYLSEPQYLQTPQGSQSIRMCCNAFSQRAARDAGSRRNPFPALSLDPPHLAAKASTQTAPPVLSLPSTRA